MVASIIQTLTNIGRFKTDFPAAAMGIDIGGNAPGGH